MGRKKIPFLLADFLAAELANLTPGELRKLRLLLIERLPEFIHQAVEDAKEKDLEKVHGVKNGQSS